MVLRLTAGTIIALVALFGVAFAGQEKLEVCHATGAEDNPFVLIEIADPAFDTHLAHGDFLAPENGDCSDGGGGQAPLEN